MKDFEEEEIAAYEGRIVIPRRLVYLWARDRTTGDLHELGFSNVTGNVTLPVRDGLTQEIVERNFTSRGALVSIGDIAMTGDISVRSVDVTLSQLNEDVTNAFRGYDLRNAEVQIYRALFDVANPREIVKPARCRFAGFINTSPLVTPAEGGMASLTLNCVDCTRELTNTNSDLRSDESQQRRAAGDRFFQYAPATGQVKVFWGQNKG